MSSPRAWNVLMMGAGSLSEANRSRNSWAASLANARTSIPVGSAWPFRSKNRTFSIIVLVLPVPAPGKHEAVVLIFHDGFTLTLRKTPEPLSVTLKFPLDILGITSFNNVFALAIVAPETSDQ